MTVPEPNKGKMAPTKKSGPIIPSILPANKGRTDVGKEVSKSTAMGKPPKK